MKPALLAVGSAALAGVVFYLAGRPLDLADYAVICLGATLLAWTFEQYWHRNHPGL